MVVTATESSSQSAAQTVLQVILIVVGGGAMLVLGGILVFAFVKGFLETLLESPQMWLGLWAAIACVATLIAAASVPSLTTAILIGLGVATGAIVLWIIVIVLFD